MKNYLKNVIVGAFSLQEQTDVQRVGVDDDYQYMEQKWRSEIQKLRKPIDNSVTIGATRYSDLQEIGAGHHGTVYKGFDPSGDTVVIKKTSVAKLYPRDSSYRYMKKALRSELQTLKHGSRDAGHPNVIRYINGEVISHKWKYPLTELTIATEFCENGDVAGYIDDLKAGDRDVPKMDESRARSYLNQLADGLKFIQSKGINYSGIKPANLLLTDNYKTLKICDFGFAKYRGLFGSTRRRDIIGCGEYLAPEVFDHIISYDERATIWSIGVTMYEMLYQQPPGLPRRINRWKRLELKFPDHPQVSPEMKLFLINCIQPVRYRIGFQEFYHTIAHDLKF